MLAGNETASDIVDAQWTQPASASGIGQAQHRARERESKRARDRERGAEEREREVAGCWVFFSVFLK